MPARLRWHARAWSVDLFSKTTSNGLGDRLSSASCSHTEFVKNYPFWGETSLLASAGKLVHIAFSSSRSFYVVSYSALQLLVGIKKTGFWRLAKFLKGFQQVARRVSSVFSGNAPKKDEIPEFLKSYFEKKLAYFLNITVSSCPLTTVAWMLHTTWRVGRYDVFCTLAGSDGHLLLFCGFVYLSV